VNVSSLPPVVTFSALLKGRSVRIVLGDPMLEMVKLLPEPGIWCNRGVAPLQCCGGNDFAHPRRISSVAPNKLFEPMMPERTILTRHLSGIPTISVKISLIEQNDHFGE
jgi:hypothetical protein